MKKLTLLLVLCLAGSALAWYPQKDCLSGYDSTTRCQQSKRCAAKELDTAYNAWILKFSAKNKKTLESCIAAVLDDGCATIDEKSRAMKYKKYMDNFYTKKTVAKPSASRTPTQPIYRAMTAVEMTGYCMPSAPKAPEKELSTAEKKAKAKEAKKTEWKAKRDNFHKSHSPKLVSNPWP